MLRSFGFHSFTLRETLTKNGSKRIFENYAAHRNVNCIQYLHIIQIKRCRIRLYHPYIILHLHTGLCQCQYFTFLFTFHSFIFIGTSFPPPFHFSNQAKWLIILKIYIALIEKCAIGLTNICAHTHTHK